MITDILKSRLTDSIKARDMERVALLRLLISAINYKEVELRTQKIEMLDKHILKTIQKEIKQRNDSIESYKAGNRQDLVDKETTELKLLEEILTEFSPHEEQ